MQGHGWAGPRYVQFCDFAILLVALIEMGFKKKYHSKHREIGKKERRKEVGDTMYVPNSKFLYNVSTGLREMHCNPPLAMTASRAKGYDMGLLAILEKPDDVSVYAGHPSHLV